MLAINFVLLVFLGTTQAAVTPTTPGPGESFKTGSPCPIAWTSDTTGSWTNFSIDLMSGSNLAMQPVTNVAKNLDGTKGATTYSWTCPDVTPNSAIYFYQFSQIGPSGPSTTWTTRFTIASSTGATAPPANEKQPEGQPIPWGIGKLTSGSAPPPASVPLVTNATSTADPAAVNMTALTTTSTALNGTTTNSTSTGTDGVTKQPAVTGNPPTSSSNGGTSLSTGPTTSTVSTGTTAKTGTSSVSGSTAGTTSDCVRLLPGSKLFTVGFAGWLVLRAV